MPFLLRAALDAGEMGDAICRRLPRATCHGIRRGWQSGLSLWSVSVKLGSESGIVAGSHRGSQVTDRLALTRVRHHVPANELRIQSWQGLAAGDALVATVAQGMERLATRPSRPRPRERQARGTR